MRATAGRLIRRRNIQLVRHLIAAKQNIRLNIWQQNQVLLSCLSPDIFYLKHVRAGKGLKLWRTYPLLVHCLWLYVCTDSCIALDCRTLSHDFPELSIFLCTFLIVHSNFFREFSRCSSRSGGHGALYDSLSEEATTRNLSSLDHVLLSEMSLFQKGKLTSQCLALRPGHTHKAWLTAFEGHWGSC